MSRIYAHSFETVGKGSQQVLDAAERAGFAVTPEIRLAAKFAAAAHDIVIRKSVNITSGTFGYGLTMRYRGATGEIPDEETGTVQEVEMMPAPVREALKSERWQKGNEEASWLEVEHIFDEADPDG